MRDNAGYPFGRGDDGKHATLLAYSEYANFGGGLYIPSKFSYIDGLPANGTLTGSISPNTVGTLVLNGIWNLSLGNHKIRVTNGIADITQNVVAEVRKDGLVGYWKFDEGSGTTTADSSGSGNGGQLKNGTAATCGVNGACPAWTSGKFGGALQFDGIGDYVDFPNTANTFESGDHTFIVWAKSTGTRDSGKFILDHYNWYFRWDSDTNIRFGVGRMNDGAGPTYGINADVSTKKTDWLYLVGVYKPSAQRIYFYVDGIYINEVNIGTNIIYTGYGSQNLRLAKSTHGASTYYLGTIDEARIYNKALTPDEMINLKSI